ncbi:MAG: TSUP family transporter [Vicinamibacterales bacterium]
MIGFLLILGAAALAGCVDAMVGGGGLIQLPALFAAYPGRLPADLLGTNKCASIVGTASAVARFARSVVIPWRVLGVVAPIALAASLGGAVLATRVPPDLFRPLVPLLLLAVLLSTVGRRDFGHVHAPRTMQRPHYALAALLVAAISLYDGFFGPGTGSFFMVLFVRLFGYDLVNAAASARVLNVATNLAAVLWFGWHGHVLWPLGLGMAVFNVAGAQVGSRLALRGGARLMRPVFIGVVLALVVKTAHDVFVATYG